MEILLLFGFICFLLWFARPKGAIGEGKVSRKIGSLVTGDSEYYQFDNVILKTPGGSTEIDHILISPYGIFVIDAKNFKGWIFGNAHQKKWTQSLKRSYKFHSLFNKYKFQFQNPIHQNYKHVKAVQNFLGADSKSVLNVVVFVGDSRFMTVMPENVMELHGLLPYIKSHTERILNSQTVEEFCKKLRDYTNSASITLDDHMKNIEQNERKPICPRCGIPMVSRIARKGPGTGSEFWGCSNYPSCKATKKGV